MAASDSPAVKFLLQFVLCTIPTSQIARGDSITATQTWSCLERPCHLPGIELGQMNDGKDTGSIDRDDWGFRRLDRQMKCI